jgi:membrane protease YdiL (CAAX protease family)
MLPMFTVTGLGNWFYPCCFLLFGLMASLPFLLARMAPRAADFDSQWLPKGWWQYLGILVLILLMFATGRLAGKLTICLNLGSHRPYFVPSLTSFSRWTIAVTGLIMILATPVAEEIFWRGYVLDQLRKLTHWAIALPVHAFLFALAHFIMSTTVLLPLGAFLYALVLGAWRIRFKALLPLILSHILINAAAMAPILSRDYQNLCLLENVAPDILVDAQSNPKCQQVASLTRQPAAKALPALIRFLGDSSDAVRICAMWAIKKFDRDDVQPYLREALASSYKNTVDGALWVIEDGRYSGLREEVRHLVWSSRDRTLRISATETLRGLGDSGGIKKIAEKHPDKTVREFAKRILRPGK